MNPRRQLFTVALVAIAATLVIGSGGFTVADELDRGVTIDQADDEDAYIGYDVNEDLDGVFEDEEISLLTVTNQLPYEIDVEPEVETVGSSIELTSKTETITIGPGNSKEIQSEVTTCEFGSSSDVVVNLDVSNDSFDGWIDGSERKFQISCAENDIEYVRFMGNTGNAEINLTAGNEITATVHTLSNGNHNAFDNLDIEADSPIRPQLPNESPGNYDIVGIQVGDDIYLHPGYDTEDCTFSPSNEDYNITEPTGTEGPFESC